MSVLILIIKYFSLISVYFSRLMKMKFHPVKENSGKVFFLSLPMKNNSTRYINCKLNFVYNGASFPVHLFFTVPRNSTAKRRYEVRPLDSVIHRWFYSLLRFSAGMFHARRNSTFMQLLC